MNKFSKIENDSRLPIEKEDYLYDGYLKIKSKDGWEFVVEKDCSIGIVHLLDFNEILLRKEVVPPFQERHSGQEYFLTMLSGTMEDGETPIDTLKRELVEEAGILLNTLYNDFQDMGEYFWNKGNSSKAHIYYIPLRINDFQKTKAVGDGSEIEKQSKTVRVDTKYIESLKPSDILTAYCLEKIKNLL